jgi:hypothetical protein
MKERRLRELLTAPINAVGVPERYLMRRLRDPARHEPSERGDRRQLF